MADWQQAKARRQSNQQIASAIEARIKFHLPPPDDPIYKIEFSLCKGYYCGAVLPDTRYTWCESCRKKYEQRA